MKSDKARLFAVHAMLALAVSYGLSVFFWLGLGVYNLYGFIGISALAAAIGLAVGWLGAKRLWLTGLMTLITRIALYFFMTAG